MRFPLPLAIFLFSAGVAFLLAVPTARADEGMWVFNNLPLAHAQGPVRLRAAGRLGRSSAVVGRPLQ